MAEMTVADWKNFLEARIEQERGNDERALSVFDGLLERYPDNAHLSSSRAFALDRLGRGQEAAASRIAARYAGLGQALVGANDTPDVWISALRDVVNDADQPGKNVSVAPGPIAW
jgi:hypothetical protein